MENQDNPLNPTLDSEASSLKKIICLKERFRRSFLPRVMVLYNTQMDTMKKKYKCGIY